MYSFGSHRRNEGTVAQVYICMVMYVRAYVGRYIRMCKCRYVYIGWLCRPHKLGTVGLGFYHRSVQGTYVCF